MFNYQFGPRAEGYKNFYLKHLQFNYFVSCYIIVCEIASRECVVCLGERASKLYTAEQRSTRLCTLLPWELFGKGEKL